VVKGEKHPAGIPGVRDAATQAGRALLNLLPIILGVLLLTSLLSQVLPRLLEAGLFGESPILDALAGAGLGSIAAGQPVVSYLLGGELNAGGVSLEGVTALVVAWVTVGVTHLPLEAQVFGWRFAVLRNLLAFVSVLCIAFIIPAVFHG
jgi:hypothetical protein